MTTIQVKDEVGPICVGTDDSVKIYELTREALDRGDDVCLDFTGVTHVLPPFLMDAVGGLYRFYAKEELERRLKWRGLSKIDENIMQIVQEHAILFFSASPAVQEELIAASLRYPGEYY